MPVDIVIVWYKHTLVVTREAFSKYFNVREREIEFQRDFQ